MRTLVNDLLLCLSVCITASVLAQQTPTFSDYNDNALIINPAHSGLSEDVEVALTNRGMFNSLDGAPRYSTLTASVPKEYSSFGAGILRDQIGVTSSTQFFASYAYKIFLSQDNNIPRYHNYEQDVLSFGISAGALQYAEDLLDLGIVGDINFAQNISATIPTIGAGVLFNKRKFYVGVSAPNIVGDLLASDENIQIEVPFYGYAGYRIFIGDLEKFYIKPNALLKMAKGVPAQLDMNLFANYKNKVEAGVGYRTNAQVNLLVGFYLFDNFRFNFTYNMAVNDSPLGNTQGLSLSYRSGNGYRKNR